MRKACPRLVELAQRVLRSPPPGDDTASDTTADALVRSCEALRPRVTQLVGREGFRALLSRALSLALGGHPWLGGVQVDVEGSLTGLEETLTGRDAVREAGCAAVLAHLIGLLTAFIGAELTRQLLSGAWPDIPIEDADFGAQERNA